MSWAKWGSRKKTDAERYRELAEERMADMPLGPESEPPEAFPTYSASTAKVSVEGLPGGLVSVRMAFPDRTVMLTLSPEAALDLSMQILGAASGRLGPG